MCGLLLTGLLPWKHRLMSKHRLIWKHGEHRLCHKREMLMDMVRCKETQHDTRLNMCTFFCCFWLCCMLTPFVCLCGQPANCCCARHQSQYRPGVLLQKGIGLGLAAVTSYTRLGQCSEEVHSCSELCQTFNAGRSGMEKRLCHGQHWLSGCFPMVERRTISGARPWVLSWSGQSRAEVQLNAMPRFPPSSDLQFAPPRDSSLVFSNFASDRDRLRVLNLGQESRWNTHLGSGFEIHYGYLKLKTSRLM